MNHSFLIDFCLYFLFFFGGPFVVYRELKKYINKILKSFIIIIIIIIIIVVVVVVINSFALTLVLKQRRGKTWK